MKLRYIVEIISDESGEVVEYVDCGNSMRKAERIRDGISINLDHNNYTVFISIQEEK